MYVRDYQEPYRSTLLSLGANENQKIFLRNGYPCLCIKGHENGIYIHRAVMAKKMGVDSLPRTTFVHHINEDRSDFLVENLEACTHGEHNALHKNFGEKNHFFGKTHTEKTKNKISEFAKKRTDLTRDDKGRFEWGRTTCL